MPVVNPLARELVFKIVYYGPGLGGKTTTLQYIHATTKAEHRGKMVSLATPVDRTLYFDFLPIRLPEVRNMGVRLQLFTVPGQVYYNATRRLVLTGADGIVFVADSQNGRLDANLESLANLNDNLREQGKSLADVPHVIVYNKRDLYDIASIEELERQLDKHGAPSFATCASTGEGVYETLDAIARAVLEDFERRNPTGEAGSTRDLEVPEGGLTQALRDLEEESQVASGLAEPAKNPNIDTSPLGLDEPSAEPAGEEAARAISVPSRPSPQPSQAEAEPVAMHETTPTSSGTSWKSSAGVERTPTPPSPTRTFGQARGVSFRSLWPESETEQVDRLELAVVEERYSVAVEAADELVSRALAAAAAGLGNISGVPRDASVVALLMGLDGRRYLEFRVLVRDCRNGEAVSLAQALAAYSFAVEARLSRARLRI